MKHLNRLDFLLILAVVTSTSTFTVHAQHHFLGMPVIEYFGSPDHRGGIQNYQIRQDYPGLINVANNLGLLQYDGTNWSRFQTPKQTKVRAVMPDPSGRIYVGAQNEFGYFFPDKQGLLTYHSLTELIPEAYRSFEDVWDIHPYEQGYAFITMKEVFVFNGKAIEVIPMEGRLGFTYFHEERIYAQFEERGLMHLEQGRWTAHHQGQSLIGKNIAGIATYSREFDLIATYESGLYLVSRHEVIPWATSVTAILKKHKVNDLYRLRGGAYAVGTNTDGLYILDDRGNMIYHFTKDKGLRNRTIIDIFQDTQGNIWLSQANGISKIEWNSPFSRIDEELGLPGTGYVALSTETHIYYGTNNGLYYHAVDEKPILEGVRAIPEIEGQVYNLQRINGEVFVSCHFGAYTVDGTRVRQLSDRLGWWTFIETPTPGIVIAGGYEGLFLIRKKGNTWYVDKKYSGFAESSRVMAFDSDNTLWMTHGYKGVFAFRFSDDYFEIKWKKFYGKEDGFPSNVLINVFQENGNNIFPSERGIYQYSKQQDRFIPHPTLNTLIGADAHVRELTEDGFGNIYFIAVNRTGKLIKNTWDEYNVETTIFNAIHPHLNDDLENISIFDQSNVLFAANSGFIHYNDNLKITGSETFDVLMRKVLVTKSDSLLFGGNFVSEGSVVKSQSANAIPVLPYADNSIEFHYSGLSFSQAPTYYRFQLDGFDRDWSEWTPRAEKEYTNLPEGRYAFKVQAKNTVGTTSTISVFNLLIAPPWYRTRTAYLAYFLSALGCIGFILYMNRRKLNREKKFLILTQERRLVQKDNQLKEVSRKSQEEIDRLKNEKLRADIRHKNKELATSTMHLLDKNNFINSIKSELKDIIQSGKTDLISKDLKKIIKQIEKNISEDDNWDQFEIHFDEVHDNFLQKLRNDYPAITPQEIKLSAYLRMNMSTKEIADLLRISVRGVEIARYRLRKKLQLTKETNLTEFMMAYGTS